MADKLVTATDLVEVEAGQLKGCSFPGPRVIAVLTVHLDAADPRWPMLWKDLNLIADRHAAASQGARDEDTESFEVKGPIDRQSQR